MNGFIIIGFMGSGKSTIGQLLAEEMAFEFLDTDALIEKSEEIPIHDIFQFQGEEAFRKMEKRQIELLSGRKQYVLSVGGGLPAIEGIMSQLNLMGTTIYLKVSKDELTRRLIYAKQKRPLLLGMDEVQLKRFIEERLEERRPYYEQAKVIIEDDRLTIDRLKDQLSEYII